MMPIVSLDVYKMYIISLNGSIVLGSSNSWFYFRWIALYFWYLED